MRKLRIKLQKQKNLIVAVLTVAICVLGGTTAWATLSFVKPGDATHAVEQGHVAEIPADLSETGESRAPEPTTMALFGSGVLGMIVSFVRRTYAAVKRLIDIVGSVIAIVLLSPLYLLTAILIKLTSRGPILYTQTRVGRDGEEFQIYKFRTMKVDAEKESGPVWAAADDNRLTLIGGFLRKAHIDEIPQFINVLRGEMSIIGPRPERPVFVSKLQEEIPDYTKRLAVKPGITGLAQVWHRYDETIEDVKKKIKYDLLYIRKMCLWTDVRIMFRTFRVVLTGEGAR
jgi:exopolysaccharide biosynthesis polyprenyl glycosylphosphotransferase